jgi:methyltransferase (TIGR00027 family)
VKDTASFTASLIAVARGLGGTDGVLPPDARLVHDPFGLRFATRSLAFVARHARLFAPLLERMLLAVQVRTRLIDDVLLTFLQEGGDQVLLLGAGFDCRAARFAGLLGGARVFEIDHPATQRVKRERLEDPPAVTYLPWDFEARALGELPAALAALGHDARRPTLTIWEGVTMYLTEPAIDASVRAVAALSAPGSPFVFTYMDRAALRPRGLVVRLVRSLLTRGGEPLLFGFHPPSLPAWLAARAFASTVDLAFGAAAQSLLPARYRRWFVDETQRLAVARRQ